MHVERIVLTNFRCFGPTPVVIDLASSVTAFVGANGAGKTAVLQALQRLFGITGEQRRLRRQDFHVPAAEAAVPSQRTLAIEAILAFPELDAANPTAGAVPEFFQQMAADDAGRLKCRLRLESTWTDDGSSEGAVEQKYAAVRTLGAFVDADCVELKALDRARIQMIYVPASRDGASQVSAFLRSRLWRAINWSEAVRTALSKAGATLNEAFAAEAAVDLVEGAVTRRWQQVHAAGTDTNPVFRPIDLRFQEFVRKVEVVFHPDEAGRERALEDLSDGQRSLFHLAMVAATLDIEASIAATPGGFGIPPGGVYLPALTLLAFEEPENNLAPFYLSRIIRQVADLTAGARAQAIVSSHSASILARVEPTQVRHFRLDPTDRTGRVHAIRLPQGEEEASKFVREAVRTYPELYFARFAVLGEGASEEIVIPKLAEAMGSDVDRSFVAVVPLGGRHVNHLWRLLADLDVPHATLLDLDWGREGGGWPRIKNVCAQLLAVGVAPAAIFGRHLDAAGPAANLAAFDARKPEEQDGFQEWIKWLRQFNVFFCAPLDLDYSMLRAFPAAYQVVEPGRQGPSQQGDPRIAVLGEAGRGDLYRATHEPFLRWYRYLFLGRGKPGTHVRVLSGLGHDVLAAGAPEEIKLLIAAMAERLALHPAPPASRA